MSVDLIQHEFIAIDEGLGNLLHVNEGSPSKNWIVPIGQPQARDMQLVGGNKILIGHHHGYTEFDIATGRIVKEFTALEGVTAARRQSNGNTIVAGVDVVDVVGQCFQLVADSRNKKLNSETGETRCPTRLKGVVVVELDANDREIHRAAFPGDSSGRRSRGLISCRATTASAKARVMADTSANFQSPDFITRGNRCGCRMEICW